MRLAVALAFADASIVVLALPQIVNQLHTSISHVTWVIMAYNLALIVGVLAFLPFARLLSSRRALIGGLALFGAASLGCGVAGSLEMLVALRCLQGAGGALLLCASLPLLGGVSRRGASTSAGWAAAAAVGAAIGPAAGGVLTQLFDWRAIFLAQAPAAALAAVAVLSAGVRSRRTIVDDTDQPRGLSPGAANVALALLSAGLIGALFLVVILLINVWLLEPLAAAGIVSAIPLATVLVERGVRGRSAGVLGGAGAILLALGLALVALLSHRQLGWVVIALGFCGAGLGLAFPTLTAAALSGAGSPTVRAGRTVAAREAGIVLGLLILTPVFVHDLNAAPGRATRPVAKELFAAPIPFALKIRLGGELLAVYHNTPQGSLPDLGVPFGRVGAQAGASTTAQLASLRNRIQSAIERVVTRSFRRSLLYSALFALLVLPVLSLHLTHVRRRRSSRTPASAREPAG